MPSECLQAGEVVQFTLLERVDVEIVSPTCKSKIVPCKAQCNFGCVVKRVLLLSSQRKSAGISESDLEKERE